MEQHAYDAVIVGAGAAGLIAARELARGGLRVAVLDARDRIGGRAWSIDAPLAPMPVECGPEFIHGNPDVTLRLLRGYGIERSDTSDESRSLNAGSHRDVAGDSAAVQALMQRAHAALNGHDTNLAAAIAAVARDDEYELVAEILADARGFDAADPADASFAAIYEEWRGDANLETASSRIEGGYRKLWFALGSEALALGVEFRLQAQVTSIRYGADGVRVSYVDASGGTCEVRAARCLVTVPISLLQLTPSRGGIAFMPALPPERQAAFACIAMGPVVKAHALFSQPFWEALADGAYADAAFFRAPAASAFPTYWTTLPRRSGLLTAWAGGSDVTGPLRGDASEIRGAFFDGIRATFGADAAGIAETTCIWSQVCDWQCDPYARGAYSYARVGGMAARKILREPLLQCIFFAGEAYAERGEAGTVAGALETGERAAQEIIASLATPAKQAAG